MGSTREAFLGTRELKEEEESVGGRCLLVIWTEVHVAFMAASILIAECNSACGGEEARNKG